MSSSSSSLSPPSDALVEGLCFHPDVLSEDEEKALMVSVDAEPWCLDLARRTQHYGFKYDYKSRSIPQRLGDLPEWSRFLTQRLVDMGIIMRHPDQMIVNGPFPFSSSCVVSLVCMGH